MENLYTITIYTENFVGLLNRITIIFTRRHINIESITASESEIKNIHRYTIVVKTTEELVKKVVAQIEKVVDVLRAAYFTDEEIVYQEIALYKVRTESFMKGDNVEKIIRMFNARILTIEPEYIVIEKCGHKTETQQLFEELLPFGVLQFVRSGRVALTKEIKEMTAYLKELEQQRSYSVISNINN